MHDRLLLLFLLSWAVQDKGPSGKAMPFLYFQYVNIGDPAAPTLVLTGVKPFFKVLLILRMNNGVFWRRGC